MTEIRDFKCGYGNSVGISSEVTAGLGLEFPDAYKHADTMKILARAVKDHDGADFCLLPFCRTVEAEAMGANINLGNESTCPRAGEYCCTTLDEVMALPDIDFSRGRIHEVLVAASELKAEGEVMAIEIPGPLTVLNNIIDARYVFRALRKDPQALYQVMEKIADQLLLYIDEIKKTGTDIVIYSDSAGALDILGPKMLAQVTNDFTYGFVKRMTAKADGGLIILLCPKFAFALLDTDNAETAVHDFGESIDFLEAMLKLKGKVAITGQLCIKQTGVAIANGKFKELVLK